MIKTSASGAREQPPFIKRPLADIRKTAEKAAMSGRTALLMVAGCLILGGCGSQSSKLPPLLVDATTTGGSNFLCEGGNQQGAEPETASHSPQIVVRLRAGFPPGSPASKLRATLLRQGFTIHDGCSPDRSVSWAEFSQRDSNGFETYQAAFGTVFWKQDKAGRIIWSTGDIAYTGL